MCARRPNEPWYVYVFRQCAERPAAVLSVVGLTAASLVYADFKSYLHDQMQIQQDTVRILTELTGRIEHLERRLEK